jgi:hypothetical protein
MKLFTIFTSDERALEHVRAERRRIAAVVQARRAIHQEWGVRVVIDRDACGRCRSKKKPRRAAASGLAYLAQKKAQRDSSKELAANARETVAALYDSARRRNRAWRSGGWPASCRRRVAAAARRGVPGAARARSASFRRWRRARRAALARHGYGLTVQRAVAAVFLRPGLNVAERQATAAPMPAIRRQVLDAPDSTVLDLLDNLLNKGVMLNGDITLGVAGIDLIYLRLSALLCAFDSHLRRERLAGHRALAAPPRRQTRPLDRRR